MLLLSTDSPENLAERNDEYIIFSRELPPLAESTLLNYSNKWFVGSREGCSCGFRHLYIGSVELGFREPEDWYPEESEDIEATLRFISIIREIAEKGANVDCIDAWGHTSETANLDGTVQVDLSSLNSRTFRFFENHHFMFTAVNG
jgi:hypothetical protein